MINPLNLVNEILEMISNPRTREILTRRFGLKDGERQTLEAIGQSNGITRERVRQIEEAGLAVLKGQKAQSRLRPTFEIIRSHLEDHGRLRQAERLYDDLICLCLPRRQLVAGRGWPAQQQLTQLLQSQDNAQDWGCHRLAFHFILNLGDDFKKLPESDDFQAVWVVDEDAMKKAQGVVGYLMQHFQTKKEVLKGEEMINIGRSAFPSVSERALSSYVDASKLINQNHLGHFGLAHWPEISPRGVKDRAYLVLKEAGQPLHFSEVTDLINKITPSGRRAYVQTVHNELIKDPRFVLVGRGLYALASWGFWPGTVVEILKQILAQHGPLTKEAVLEKVASQRLVKANTILINLQNRRLFDRDQEGRYLLKK